MEIEIVTFGINGRVKLTVPVNLGKKQKYGSLSCR